MLCHDSGVCHQPITAEVQVQSQTIPRGICCGKSVTGATFFSKYFRFPLSASLHQCSILIHSLTINMSLAMDSDVKHNAYKKLKVSEADNNNACVLIASTTSLL
jgi:hypothetical protein